MMGFIKRHWAWTTAVVVVVIPVLVFTIWATITLHYTYSTGERAGFLQKLSKRGWICKTWEGEIQLTAIPGAAPEKFAFTVRSDSIADVLNAMAGQHVVLTYEQHVGVPTSCFGDTEYYITGAKVVMP